MTAFREEGLAEEDADWMGGASLRTGPQALQVEAELDSYSLVRSFVCFFFHSPVLSFLQDELQFENPMSRQMEVLGCFAAGNFPQLSSGDVSCLFVTGMRE